MSEEITTSASAQLVAREPNAQQVLAALKTGRIVGEPNEVYHATPAVSCSKMKIFRASPALYYGRFVTGTIPAPDPTPALLFGSAADCFILEGIQKFMAEYYVIPKDVGKQSKEDKKIRAYLKDKNPNKKSVSFDDMGKILRMNDNVQAHPFAGPLIRAGKPQITWRIKGNVFYIQIRTDIWSDDGCELTGGMPYIFDLKTIAELPDDEPETISKQMSDFWYHGQEWLYRNVVCDVCKFIDGYEPRFFFGFVEKVEPYGVKVVELDDTGHELGFQQVKDTLDRMKDCHHYNRWPLHWEDTHLKVIPSVGLPNYYLRRENAERSSLW